MSREIKFRVWHEYTDEPDLNQMIVLEQTSGRYDYERGIVLAFSDAGYAEFGAHERRPIKDPERVTFMQFTGLKDKNGKDIYEDDIVSHEDAYGPCVIEYQPAEYVACDRQGMGYDPCANCEVIGNIHEHPELLTP